MVVFCRHCNRNVQANQIEVHEETYIINGKKQIVAWVGCKDCWDLLQKVS